jgi:predicted 3-demethylubiquinone-9 3-methyltransferase (glyoxalase superfamily)
MQKITPFLWFTDNAEEAINFYVSTFKNAGIDSTTRYPDIVPGPKGKVISMNFHIEGQDFIALNGGPVPGFVFSPCDIIHGELRRPRRGGCPLG